MLNLASKGAFTGQEIIATAVHEERYGEHLGHIVVHDREGNEFGVA
jgi:hypothetical protein